MNSANVCRAAILLAVTFCTTTLRGQVQTYVWQETLSDATRYHYRIVNDSPYKVVAVDIGIDHNTGENQLNVDPVGVRDEDPIELGAGLSIDDPRTQAAPGWRVSYMLTEETNQHHIHFEIIDSSAAIMPGQSLAGFMVAVTAADPAYKTRSWRAVLHNSAVIPGDLRVDDVSAPLPTGTVSGDATICSGQSATLSISLTGNSPWTLAWSDGVSQQATQPLATRLVTPTSNRTYSLASVRDANVVGTSSGQAIITVLKGPTITTQPASQTVRRNTSVTLTVLASGTTPLSYQWYQGARGVTTTPVGTNSASFTSPKLTATTSYWVRVSNVCGNADSNAGVITIK